GAVAGPGAPARGPAAAVTAPAVSGARVRHEPMRPVVVIVWPPLLRIRPGRTDRGHARTRVADGQRRRIGHDRKGTDAARTDSARTASTDSPRGTDSPGQRRPSGRRPSSAERPGAAVTIP